MRNCGCHLLMGLHHCLEFVNLIKHVSILNLQEDAVNSFISDLHCIDIDLFASHSPLVLSVLRAGLLASSRCIVDAKLVSLCRVFALVFFIRFIIVGVPLKNLPVCVVVGRALSRSN